MRNLTKLDAKNLSSEDYIRCKNLTYREKGHMSDRLKEARYKGLKGVCYLIKDNNKLLAWALVYENKEAHFYVRKSERRKGLGTKLIKRIEKDYDNLIVEKWDDTSSNFFKITKYKVKINNDYKEKNED